MTVGAILLRATFARLPWCHWRFLALRCAPTGWPPRCGFKESLRVVTPTRAPEYFGVVGCLTRLEQPVRLPSRFLCNLSVRQSLCRVKAPAPPLGALSFLAFTFHPPQINGPDVPGHHKRSLSCGTPLCRRDLLDPSPDPSVTLQGALSARASAFTGLSHLAAPEALRCFLSKSLAW